MPTLESCLVGFDNPGFTDLGDQPGLRLSLILLHEHFTLVKAYMDCIQGSLVFFELMTERLGVFQDELMELHYVTEMNAGSDESSETSGPDETGTSDEVGTGSGLTLKMGSFAVMLQDVLEKPPTHALDTCRVYGEFEESPDELAQIPKYLLPQNGNYKRPGQAVG